MLPLPQGVELTSDPSVADWIVERLRPWGKDRVHVGSFLPEVFDAYVRIPELAEVPYPVKMEPNLVVEFYAS